MWPILWLVGNATGAVKSKRPCIENTAPYTSLYVSVKYFQFISLELLFYELSVEKNFCSVLYSILIHLPPLRFHCVEGCWDRTHAGQMQLLHWLSDALLYTVKKGYRFPVPGRDVNNQTLLGYELLNYSRPGRVW